jgi:hypothetical protein
MPIFLHLPGLSGPLSPSEARPNNLRDPDRERHALADDRTLMGILTRRDLRPTLLEENWAALKQLETLAVIESGPPTLRTHSSAWLAS